MDDNALLIEKLAQGGEGLGFDSQGRAVFVEGGLPGDHCRVLYQKVKKRWARASLEEVLEPSPLRVQPACEAYTRGCGGCTFWNLRQPEELALKAGAAMEALRRLGRLTSLPEPRLIPSPRPQNYRQRIRWSVDDRGRLGFLKQGSHDLVEPQDCPVARAPLVEVSHQIHGAIASWPPGRWFVELASTDGEVVASIHLDCPLSRLEQEQLSALASLVAGPAPPPVLRQEAGPAGKETGPAGATSNESSTSRATIEGLRGLQIIGERGERQRWGRLEVDAQVALADGRSEDPALPAGLFRQANAEVNRAMVDCMLECLAPKEETLCVELFCGSGNLSFPLLARNGQVLAAEGQGDAIEAARAIAASRGLDAGQIEFVVVDLQRDLEAFLAQMSTRAPTRLVLDPPRRGAPEVCEAIARGALPDLEEIIYVSCDPGCLARDLKTLCGQAGFVVEQIAAADMFPRTAHLEMLAQLRRVEL